MGFQVNIPPSSMFIYCLHHWLQATTQLPPRVVIGGGFFPE
jgi:hypothetical protein